MTPEWESFTESPLAQLCLSLFCPLSHSHTYTNVHTRKDNKILDNTNTHSDTSGNRN
jgi:hypothetical protein